MITRAAVKMVLPLACSWARKQEAFILDTGIALSDSQVVDARSIGVIHPERVRIRTIERIPWPLHPLLRKAAERTKWVPSATLGMTLRYGIFVRSDYANNRRLMAHELAHTAQYERFGGFHPFLEIYLHECLAAGYPFGALELEASRIAHQICSSSDGAF